MNRMSKTARRTAGVVILTGMVAGPGLIIAGLVTAFGRPCFFKQFPAASCNATNNGPGTAAVTLLVAGAVVIAVVVVVLIAAVVWARTRREERRQA